GDGIVVLPGRVDVRAVGAHDDRARALQAIDTADAVLLHLDEGERAGAGVPAEHGDRIVERTGDVHMRAVGAHRDAARLPDAVDAADAVLLHLDERQRAVAGPAEHRDGIVTASRHVHVRAVRAHRGGARAVDPVDATDAVGIDVDLREATGTRIS